MAKRPVVQDVRLSELVKPVLNANVHGILASVSSMRYGRSTQYFIATITDGDCKVRMVGFQKEQLRKLTMFCEGKKSVNLRNCQVKKSKYGEKMELVLKGNTEVLESDEKFALDEDSSRNDVITLAQVKDAEIFDSVTVKCKVTLVKDVIEVSTGKRKQDVKVGDKTGVGLVTLWEESVGLLEEDKSYILKNFSVREFGFSKYLSVLKGESEIVLIDDIGDVVVDRENEEQRGGNLIDVRIVAAPQVDSYKACLVCKARVEPTDPPLGQCSRCCMMQRYDVCAEQMSVKLLVKSG